MSALFALFVLGQFSAWLLEFEGHVIPRYSALLARPGLRDTRKEWSTERTCTVERQGEQFRHAG
jgi:hypothetical protein